MSDITTIEALRGLYGAPGERSIKKEMRQLDTHAKAFLEKSPFVVIGSSAPGRLPDVSPKGDRPGFTLVLDDRTIAIPDRPGNKRLDTFENVIENPMVGLLFLIPGMDETLRINGSARISTDAVLLERLAVGGKAPVAALVVTTKEVYLHCAKAFMRSELWNPDRHIDRRTMPTLGQMLKDQIGFSDDAVETQRAMEERYLKTMF
ncbi:pyridoxamine 5'-phosphate oxidase family protein [Fulvimarina endophytica]|uniref:Pyridoxamine 5'-phosphate oxidase family protein n=1 Tax=Fulvimarina endophytica TaxID=2293836 RepID=A0A371X7A6_9HYPH|nr:pyridoxamine 5'-phosphate oxidase family protein [Fulvimarina endophytica]RFC65096.1 pyridoxamine 5'-phosphate oxidase family protein [Fulvimarina endophytica]